MIDKNEFFEKMKSKLGLWCANDADIGNLVRATEFAVENQIDVISVVPGVVKTVWPWVEKHNIKIMPRFYFPNKKITENHIYDITAKINLALKTGADGAQVFLSYGALDTLVQQTHIIRDDLFFNKDLVIGLDIAEIDAAEWNKLFENLQKINAAAVLLVLTKDTGNKSDFVGRIYGMLKAWRDIRPGIQFMMDANLVRIEQVIRLVKKMRPELTDKLRFFVKS